MKIICIGMNYAEHIKELKKETPQEPVFFCKPDTALLIRNRPFYIPDFTKEPHYETELVLRICKVGKNIEPKFASSYYDAYTLGFDFTARDLQRKCFQENLPWEMSKGFDNSAAIGEFIPKEKFPQGPQQLHFEMKKNGEVCQRGDTSDMIFTIDRIISHVSKFLTLRTGDYIFTGTPPGIGKIEIGDKLEACLEGIPVLRCAIK
ncbi:MAG: fumarylacetoacetate hydrolase family protein [Bacteroides sp.]|nr:fumarylacetoacetate hydrolase family protein [Ruminococcus flavefaciens]MCM1554773.1 fumarylacetoacetate hydrolase family protein [Bacteroides sp.]